jgi:hypothetical protein
VTCLLRLLAVTLVVLAEDRLPQDDDEQLPRVQ